MHASHPPIKSGSKAPATVLAPLWLVNQMNAEKLFSFILGGKVCRTHLEVGRNRDAMPMAMEVEEENNELEESFQQYFV